MKKILFIMSILFSFCFLQKAEAQTFVFTKRAVSVYDTLSANGADTLKQTTGMLHPYHYSVWYKIDSLSGSTGGKLYVEVSPYGRDQWYRKDSVTIDGVTTQGYISGNVVTGGNIRLRTKLDSGTQSTKEEKYMQTFRKND